MIQAAARGWQVRRRLNYRYRAASKIQCLWRSFSAQVQFQLDLLDIVAVQSVARRKLAIIMLKRAHAFAVVIQKAARRRFAFVCVVRRRKHLAEQQRTKESASKIQVRGLIFPCAFS
jgi:hypothetical protein